MQSFLHHSKINAADIDSSFDLNSNRRPNYVLLLLLPFFAILVQAPFVAVRGQKTTAITVVGVSPGAICSSSNPTLVDVEFTARYYNPGNVFIALLSGPNGSFVNSTPIGTLHSAGELVNILFAEIPANTPVGDGYQVRVIASNPSNNSLNSVPFEITGFIAPTLTLSKQDVSSCGDGFDGTITGVATGGNPPYRFNFLSGAGDEQRITNGLMVSNLAPFSNYIMRVTDASECIVQENTSLVKISLPSIEVSTLGNESACGTGGTDGGGFFTLRIFPRTDTIANAIKPYFFQMVSQGADTTSLPYVEKPVPITFNNLVQGAYMVTMHDGAGCQSNTLENIAIGKDSALVLDLSGWGNPTTCGGTNGDITVLATGGSHSTYRYSLSTDGGITYGPIQSGRRFGGLAAGTYVIKGMDSRGCFDTLHKTLNDPKGCSLAVAGSTGDLNLMAKNAPGLQVFPNPTRTSFTLSLQSNSKESVQIIVTDIVGKKLYQTTGSGSNRQYTFGSEFSSGMYIVQVIQGKQIQTLKLVKGN